MLQNASNSNIVDSWWRHDWCIYDFSQCGRCCVFPQITNVNTAPWWLQHPSASFCPGWVNEMRGNGSCCVCSLPASNALLTREWSCKICGQHHFKLWVNITADTWKYFRYEPTRRLGIYLKEDAACQDTQAETDKMMRSDKDVSGLFVVCIWGLCAFSVIWMF